MLADLPKDIQIGKMLIMTSIYSETLEFDAYQIEIKIEIELVLNCKYNGLFFSDPLSFIFIKCNNYVDKY